MAEATSAETTAQSPEDEEPGRRNPNSTRSLTSRSIQTSEPPAWEKAVIKAILWFSFSVFLSVLPLAAAFFFLSTKGEPIAYSKVAGDGELLIITTGMAAAAAGDLWAKGAAKEWITAALACLNTALAIFTTLWFGYITALTDEQTNVDEGFIATGSTVMFFVSLIASGMSVIRAELRQE